MAKVKMICPFSGKLCKECALFRGKHYFLCFKDKYRGYIKEFADTPAKNDQRTFHKDAVDLFNLDALSKSKSLDPFSRDMPDIE